MEAVQSAENGVEGRGHDARVHTHPESGVAPGADLDVGDRGRLRALSERMLRVVAHDDAGAEGFGDGRDEGRDGAVADAVNGLRRDRVEELAGNPAPGPLRGRDGSTRLESETTSVAQVFVPERVPDLLRRELEAALVGRLLNALTELDGELARQ